MRIQSTLAALTLAGAMAAVAAPAAQADTVYHFGDRNFGVTLRVDDGHRAHRHNRGHGHAQQVHHNRQSILTPRQVRRELRQSGFRQMTRPDYRPNRNVYVVDGVNSRGRDVRIRVDASSGAIIAVRPRAAQGRGHQVNNRISPNDARRIVRRSGFVHAGAADYRAGRNIYLVEAINTRGHWVRVSVNARNGDILAVRR